MAAHESEDPAVELFIVPKSDRYGEDDDRWHDQVNGFWSDLQSEVGGVVVRHTPEPHTKGAIQEVILALGSAGAFRAASDYLRSWLSRDKSRRLEIRWAEDGEERNVVVTGEAIDSEALNLVARAVASRLSRGDAQAGS